jgi:lysophospholipase L1-like esterase
VVVQTVPVRSPRSRNRAGAVAPAFVAAALGLVVLTSCDQSGNPAGNGRVPPPAIEVSGDPAAISGAADHAAEGAGDIDTVVMIGDSITRGATAYLDERYGLLGLDHVIEAQNNKRMAVSIPNNPSGASIVEFLAANGDGDHSDEVWVIALGTNDVGQYSSPDDLAAAVNEIVASVPDDAALVWVDVHFRDRSADAARVNSIIRDRVERRGDSVVAPWTAFVDGDGVVSGDGVHPTTDGADVFAFVVTDTVRAFLDR